MGGSGEGDREREAARGVGREVGMVARNCVVCVCDRVEMC